MLNVKGTALGEDKREVTVRGTFTPVEAAIRLSASSCEMYTFGMAGMILPLSLPQSSTIAW
jgi:hypothetical protein